MKSAAIQTELHRHLDVSTRITTLLELSQANGLVSQGLSLDAFREKIILSKPLSNLDEVLGTFTLFQKILDRPESLERIAREAVEDCYREGTRAVEFRFSLNFVTQFSNLSWDDALSAIERGIDAGRRLYPEMKVGLICIASRDFGPDAAARTVEYFLKNRGRFIAMDLAGPESSFPCKAFREAFQPLREANCKITIHAGEDSGPENIWQAIEDLGAQRIGHGIRSVEDPKLLEILQARQICLEVCPTSNWITQAVTSLVKHPLPQLLRAGVPVSINTDDPGVFGSTLPAEYSLCVDIIGISYENLQTCKASAQAHSFLEFCE